MERKKEENGKLNTKLIVINMFFSIVSFCLNLCIGFFIAPYITKQFGSEAYGFVKLSNDFTSYASLFSIALNSMACRFLMMESTKGNIVDARKYYSSIFLANVVLTAILSIPSFVCVYFLENFLEIPVVLVLEVKLTFAITFLAFLLNLVGTIYGNCYYLSNKLYLSSIRDSVVNVVKVVCIICLFIFAKPRIVYVALGGGIATVLAIVYNIYFTRKLTPEYRFIFSDFEWKKLWTVLSAGIWNSITKLSQIFSSGLDLMISNLFIGSKEMGYLALAKTVPNLLVSFNASVANVFSPNLMLLYAKNDMEELHKVLTRAMRFMCLFVSVPIAVLISMGGDFFELWVPEQPSKLICTLSVLTIVNACVTGPMQPIYQIFTITNKIRQSSIVMIIYGFVSVLVTFVFLVTTDVGLYAVAGVSLVGSIIVALGYHLPYAAKYIGLPWYTFYKEIVKSVVSLASVCVIGYFINSFFDLNTWWLWFFGAGSTAVIGIIVNFCWMLNKEEKKGLFSIVKSKIHI